MRPRSIPPPLRSFRDRVRDVRVARPVAGAFFSLLWTSVAVLLAAAQFAHAQLVILPAPRLLTMMPMGARIGSTVEVAITSESAEECTELLFSTPKVTARPKTNEKGEVEKNKFLVTVDADAKPGLCEARLFAKLGVSSSRTFSLGVTEEVTRREPNTSIEKALALGIDSICNAFTTAKSVDFYRFEARKGQRLTVECATTGIESKLTPVVIVADDKGRDLVAERRTGFLEFTAPASGTYLLKVHGLTFQGGPEHFYRLALLSRNDAVTPALRQASIRNVNAATVPLPEHIPADRVNEQEPNNRATEAQIIRPPCVIHGAFATAGDVDTFDFDAQKGDVWWLEVVSERTGLPTDPFVLVQKLKADGSTEDVVEINDMISPVKVSSNGYAYDGPPYDIGSADSLGKLEIKESGRYRIQVRDLFGGTRAVPHHTYALIVRKAAPDFALAAWAQHKELRNGDRAALSKPVALRGGATMPFEVVAVRRDGFDGPIELTVENLPPGVTASGLRIPANKNVGTVLLTAAENAPRGLSLARIRGRARVGDRDIVRDCPAASMTWPVRDASGETPVPRLLEDLPVSVGGEELTPLTIAPVEDRVWEAPAGDKLIVPLKLTWRGDFSAGSVKMTPLGLDLSGIKPIDVASKAAESSVEIDTAALKLPPGEYTFALLGGVVAKYPSAPRPPQATNEAALQATAPALPKADPPQKADGAPRAGTAPAAAPLAPKEIVDVVASEPIRIRVKPVSP